MAGKPRHLGNLNINFLMWETKWIQLSMQREAKTLKSFKNSKRIWLSMQRMGASLIYCKTSNWIRLSMQRMWVALICCSHRGPISRLINTQTAARWDFKKKQRLFRSCLKNNKKCVVLVKGGRVDQINCQTSTKHL